MTVRPLRALAMHRRAKSFLADTEDHFTYLYVVRRTVEEYGGQVGRC